MRIILSLLLIFLFNKIYANEILFNSLQLSKQEFKLAVCKTFFEQNGSFELSQNTGYKNKGNNNLLKIFYNPYDEIYWWLELGQEKGNIEFNPDYRLESVNNGFLYGAGARYQLFPETIVSPGLSFDLGIRFCRIDFKKMLSSNSIFLIDDSLDIFTGRLNLVITKKNLFSKNTEPYAGLNIYRVYSRLLDNNSLGSVDGYKDNFNITAGIKLKIYPFEWFVLEAGLINDPYYSIGFGWGY